MNGCKVLGTVSGKQRMLRKLKAIFRRFIYSRGKVGVSVPGPHRDCRTKLPPLTQLKHFLSLSFFICEIGILTGPNRRLTESHAHEAQSLTRAPCSGRGSGLCINPSHGGKGFASVCPASQEQVQEQNQIF